MIDRFVRDETGMTMGLAVIMIVLIGVMGAGLLVFVQRDLNTVVEVNQGQRGFEWAEAGMEAAEVQLSADANRERYDGAGSDDYEWSCDWDGSECTGAGKTLNLDGTANRVNVKIQYLKRATTPDETRLPDYAPEPLPSGETKYPADREYFKVITQGTAEDANRRIEAIFYTRDTGFPMAWYSSSTMDFNGNALSVENVSVFSTGNILNFRANNLTGCDSVYGTWDRPPWNSTARTAASTTCTRSDGSTYTGYPVGVGTTGTIDYKSPGPSSRPGIDYSNYDGSGVGSAANPDFVPNTWTASGGAQSSSDISYPFNPDANTQLNLDTLRLAAGAGRYGSRLITLEPGDTFNLADYPSPSSLNTVYFIEFVNPDGTYTNGSGAVDDGKVNYTSDLADFANTNGTIVVVNGDFDGSPSSDNYRGIIVLRDPIDDDSVTMDYTSNGNFDPAAIVNVEGTVIVSGDSDAAIPDAVLNKNRPGFYTVERWSWRECYNTACN